MGISFTERLSGLSARYLLTLFAIGTLLSVLLIAYASIQQRNTVYGEMRRRGELLGESLAGACGLPYLLGDAKSIDSILSRAKGIEDVEAVALMNRTGRVDFLYGDAWVGQQPMDLKLSRERKVWQDGERLHVLAPLAVVVAAQPEGIAGLLSGESASGGQAAKPDFEGWVHVVLSLARARRYVRTLILHSVLATLAIILFGSGISFYFFRLTVILPVRRLAEAMRAVRQGQLGIELEGLSGAGEVGTLTRAFNRMSEELHAAQEQLRRANAELEERVQERTRDLERANEELKESQDKVVRSEKLAAIGRLASGVGHELRNPLGAIRNAIYYIRDSLQGTAVMQEDPTLGEFFDLADKEIKSATRIIGDLLEFSRVVKLAPQPTDVNELVAGIKSSLEIPAGIRVAESYQADLPQAMIDPQRLRQVFINLATNAMQAMPKGGDLRLATRLEEGAEGGAPWISVDFQDSGSGIAPENLKKLFEPLFTTKAKGTGLGLAISRGYVEAHGGKIVVASEPGKGSTFTVRFPVGTAKNA